MLLALEASGVVSATDLSTVAGVSRATASEQLGKLVEGGLVFVERRSRLCFYRLAGPGVAKALHALDELSRRGEGPAPRSPVDPPDRAARTCYDHLAGRLGVSLLDSLLRSRHVSKEQGGAYRVTGSGRKFLGDFGVDLRQPATHRRPPGRACLDRTERRPHLAGHVGAQLAARCFQLGWVERPGAGRALAVTPRGRAGFSKTFGVDV
jgi:hypothetical protein